MVLPSCFPTFVACFTAKNHAELASLVLRTISLFSVHSTISGAYLIKNRKMRLIFWLRSQFYYDFVIELKKKYPHQPCDYVYPVGVIRNGLI